MCARPFTATGQAKLRFTRAGRLLGYVDGDGRAELRIQMLGGEDLRPPSGSAEPEAEGIPHIGAA